MSKKLNSKPSGIRDSGIINKQSAVKLHLACAFKLANLISPLL